MSGRNKKALTDEIFRVNPQIILPRVMERFEMKSMLRVGNLKTFLLRKFETLDYFSLTLKRSRDGYSGN